MSETIGDCDLNKLAEAFLSTQHVCWASVAMWRLLTYAREHGKVLCVIGVEGAREYVRYLYSQEDDDFTPADSARELHIVTLFYDYLLAHECLTANPMRELKALAVRQLVETLGGELKNGG
jgi:site-specific recombinase XerD